VNRFLGIWIWPTVKTFSEYQIFITKNLNPSIANTGMGTIFTHAQKKEDEYFTHSPFSK